MQSLRTLTRIGLGRSSNAARGALPTKVPSTSGRGYQGSVGSLSSYRAVPPLKGAQDSVILPSQGSLEQRHSLGPLNCKSRMWSSATSLLSSRSSIVKQSATFLAGRQNWNRSLASNSRVWATADVVREAREAPAPEELDREERTPLPRSLPPRPSNDVWVRPGVTPPLGASASEAPPRKNFARPPRPYPQKMSGAREPWEGHFSRSEENRLRGNRTRTAGPEADKRAAEDDKPAKAVVKKKVAMWLGYVGTDFKGRPLTPLSVWAHVRLSSAFEIVCHMAGDRLLHLMIWNECAGLGEYCVLNL